MVNKNKLISELEDVVYSSIESKNDADFIISNWIKLLELTNLNDYKINIVNPNKITIKHKAFSERINLTQKDGEFFLENTQIEKEDINYLLPHLFY